MFKPQCKQSTNVNSVKLKLSNVYQSLLSLQYYHLYFKPSHFSSASEIRGQHGSLLLHSTQLAMLPGLGIHEQRCIWLSKVSHKDCNTDVLGIPPSYLHTLLGPQEWYIHIRQIPHCHATIY